MVVVVVAFLVVVVAAFLVVVAFFVVVVAFLVVVVVAFLAVVAFLVVFFTAPPLATSRVRAVSRLMPSTVSPSGIPALVLSWLMYLP